jgi:hypothetical protein
MAISRAQLLKELLPGLNGLFGLEYKRYDAEHTQIYTTESSDRSFEEELKVSGFAAAPTKNEGDGIEYEHAQEAWVARYTHETVALGFAITEEAIEDNLYDSLSKRYTKALARSMAYTKQVKAAATLNNAFSSSYPGGDGKALCATDHPTVGGFTNANRPTVASDLNETALEAADIQISQWVDERGLLIAAKIRKLVIPPQLKFVAKKLKGTDKKLGTSDNDIATAPGIIGGIAEMHWLTDPNAWYLTTDVPNGLKHFERVALKTAMEGDFETGNVRYKARERYSFGFSDPLAIWGSPGSS